MEMPRPDIGPKSGPDLGPATLATGFGRQKRPFGSDESPIASPAKVEPTDSTLAGFLSPSQINTIGCRGKVDEERPAIAAATRRGKEVRWEGRGIQNHIAVIVGTIHARIRIGGDL